MSDEFANTPNGAPAIRGRGTSENPPNRFDEIHIERTVLDNFDKNGEALPPPKTRFYKDASKTILATNDSPDIGFSFSVNPYRGCEHGCIYCYARPTHEYLGLSAGLDFETKIFVKERAPELLENELRAKKWQPQTVFFSGVTDCYQPAERHFKLTRKCLEVLLRFKNPVSLITKNALVTRDLDLFAQFQEFNGIAVMLSITTLDEDLCGKMEPRTSRPSARLEAVAKLAKAGIRVGINAAPMIPGLTDHELPQILKSASEAGATFAGYTPVRLPFAVSSLFSNWLEQHFHDRKDKVLSHIRSLRGGRLNDPDFGSRMRGEGLVADNMCQMFDIYCRRYSLNLAEFNLNTNEFSRPPKQPEHGDQLAFDC